MNAPASRPTGRLPERRVGTLRLLWNASYDFDFKLETGQPVHADGCYIGKRFTRESFPHAFDHQTHAGLGIDEKHCEIDDIFERACSRFEHSLQVVEGELNLGLEVGLGVPSSRAPTMPETKRRSPDKMAGESPCSL